MVVVIARYLSRRLNKLNRQAAQIEQGDFKVWPDDYDSDEIGQLGAVINHMSIRLKALIDELYVENEKSLNGQWKRNLSQNRLQNGFVRGFALFYQRLPASICSGNAYDPATDAPRIRIEENPGAVSLLRNL